MSITGVKNSKAAKVKIPKTVKIGGKTFKVTAISNHASPAENEIFNKHYRGVKKTDRENKKHHSH